jgi:hypothetical protein
MSAARRPGLEQWRVNVDFPAWVIESLDREARRLGVRRQSIIKVWIAERLERGTSSAWRLACPTVPDCVSGLMTVLRKIHDAKVESPLRADAPRLPDPQS